MIPRIKYQNCTRSPTTRTLYLIKTAAGAHLRSTLENFSIEATQLEQAWTQQTEALLPHFNPTRIRKLIHKLLLYNIYEIKHITLPNGTKLMTTDDFKTYYQPPTKLIKQALNIAEQIFCHPQCLPYCPNPCPNHHPPRTLKQEFITIIHQIAPRTIEPPTHPQPLPHPLHLQTPLHIKNNPNQHPIYKILDCKETKTKDKYKIPKKYHSYLRQWNIRNNEIYTIWMQQRELFPYNYPEVINHNITLFTDYYTQKHHLYYKNIAQTYFTPDQNRDTRFIPPPQIIPLTHISINECNLENDIKVSTNTIQTQNDVAHIYEDTVRHLITIIDNRLEWLWKQYTTAKNNHHGLIPPTQTFETEIVWLYQRYKYRIPKNDQLKFAQHTLPKTPT